MDSRFLPIFVLLTTTAFAQINQPKTDSLHTVIAQITFTHADTVRALHNLFKSKRNTGNWLAYGSAATTAIAGLGTLADNNGKGNDPYFSPDAVGASLLIGIALAPIWVPGTVTLFRFTKKREKEAVEAYEKSSRLPRGLQRRLSGRFFNANYRFSKK